MARIKIYLKALESPIIPVKLPESQYSARSITVRVTRTLHYGSSLLSVSRAHDVHREFANEDIYAPQEKALRPPAVWSIPARGTICITGHT